MMEQETNRAEGGKGARGCRHQTAAHRGSLTTLDVQSGFAFAPALRAHQCAQCRNGANRGQ